MTGLWTSPTVKYMVLINLKLENGLQSAVVQETLFLVLYPLCLWVSLMSQEKVNESSAGNCAGQAFRMSTLASLAPASLPLLA